MKSFEWFVFHIVIPFLVGYGIGEIYKHFIQ